MPSRVTNSIGAHPLPFQDLHEKHLDFDSVKELPESHSWESLDVNDHSIDADHSSGSGSVPVVDLHDPNAGELVGRACKTWGVFQVTNHGVETSLLADVESAGRSLFSLPMEEKLKAARSADGISGYGVARISAFFPKLMWSEGFTIFGSPIEHARQLWPNDYNQFW
ncbi:iron ascorbate-dependent oxidoreductase [Sarracenia purpurea var. burkii]